MVSFGNVTFVRGDLNDRLGRGGKARTVWSMDF